MTAWLFVTITPDTPSSEQRSSAATTLLEFIRKWHSLSASTAFSSLEVLFELPNPDLTNLFTTTAWAKWIGEIISTLFLLQSQHQYFVVAIKPIWARSIIWGLLLDFLSRKRYPPPVVPVGGLGGGAGCRFPQKRGTPSSSSQFSMLSLRSRSPGKVKPCCLGSI